MCFSISVIHNSRTVGVQNDLFGDKSHEPQYYPQQLCCLVTELYMHRQVGAPKALLHSAQHKTSYHSMLVKQACLPNAEHISCTRQQAALQLAAQPIHGERVDDMRASHGSYTIFSTLM